MLKRLALIALVMAPALAQGPPPTEKKDVVDTYHGQRIVDPYRWLEDADSPAVQKWVEAQNAYTRQHLDPTLRSSLQQRLSQLWNYPRYSSPFKKAGKYYVFKNDGLQNQAVLYSQESLTAPLKEVLDPNALSPDGTVAVSKLEVSRDGHYLAYSLQASGSDLEEIHIRDLETGKDLSDVVRFAKFTNIAWTNDSRGFYYSRLPDPKTVPPQEQSYNCKLYYHVAGTVQEVDSVIVADKDKELSFDGTVTEDGRYLIINVTRGTDPKNQVWVKPIPGGEVQHLLPADATYTVLGNDSTVLYVNTTKAAPRGRIVAIDMQAPERGNWKELVPQGADTIDMAALLGGRFVVAALHDASHVLRLYDKAGQSAGTVKLPGLGAVSALEGHEDDPEIFISFASYLFPSTIYRYDVGTKQLSEPYPAALDFPTRQYVTELVFCHSKDGTRVPIYLTHRRDLRRDGSNPTLLYGYGGFDVNMTPRFSVPRLVWLERGGVLAVAILRGGAEYGEEWHKAGMLDKKQNVFDAFIACAQYLVAQKWTRKHRLAINGGSNGGLLVAAVEVQRPDLFGAAVSQVPVTDMLRYQKFTVGRHWIPEYGSSDDPHQFETLKKYAPLLNLKPGTSYPATLITTADSDDRVAPLHAKKFAAALQAAQGGPEPILLRVDTKAGHGAGKPTSKLIDEWADILTFLFQYLK